MKINPQELADKLNSVRAPRYRFSDGMRFLVWENTVGKRFFVKLYGREREAFVEQVTNSKRIGAAAFALISYLYLFDRDRIQSPPLSKLD